MSEFTYPFTIDNGGGEKITFLRRVPSPEGEYIEVENHVQPGSGPPMHVHFKQLESLTVVKGKLGSQVLGKEVTYHYEGETITYDAGVTHKFWNAGDEVLLCTGKVMPPHNLEFFLSEIFRSTNVNDGKRPGTFDVAFLLHRYRSEFDMLEIPVFVKKVVFPVVLFLGRFFGKYEKFKNAPEPVK